MPTTAQLQKLWTIEADWHTQAKTRERRSRTVPARTRKKDIRRASETTGSARTEKRTATLCPRPEISGIERFPQAQEAAALGQPRQDAAR